ncbi:MAG: hypothetical protein GX621_08705, partial [Pirellulaceae bacterium]|nr:hypothetical protein [Pirellulaceae bacterium]
MSKRSFLFTTELALSFVWLLLVATVWLSAVSTTFGRTWKSSNGTYSVDAELVDAVDGVVSLRKPNGDVIKVPLSRLSAEDQAYVAKQDAAESVARSATDTASATGAMRTHSQLSQQANRLRTAYEVLRLYEAFLQDTSVSESDRAAAEVELPIWKGRANKQMVRFGSRWLLPDDANDRRRQARQMVDEALHLLEVGQREAAVDKCVKASRLDESAILADFLLGLDCALSQCDAKGANRHFSECVKREPQHISSLNNLALSEIRLKRYDRALARWQTALELAPASPEVVHNLGRLLHLGKRKTASISPRCQSRVTDLYAAAASSM